MAEKQKQQCDVCATKNDPMTQNVNALLEKCNIVLKKLETKTSEQVPVPIQAPKVSNWFLFSNNIVMAL